MDGKEIQVEDGGFTRIHNAILEKLALTDLNGSEFRCLMFLFRKTYGYGKKEDKISLGQWSEGTGSKRQNVWRTLNSLVTRKIIYFIDHGPKRAQTWGFNKYMEAWSNEQSVIETDYSSSDESVIESDDSSVVEIDYRLNAKNESVIESDYKSVIHLDNNKRKKESSSSIGTPTQTPSASNTAAAAFSSKENAERELLKAFLDEYENTWALKIASPYERDKVIDWTKRIPLAAWRYGLRECADNRKVGQWRYFEKILARVEREGLQEQAPPQVVESPRRTAFALEEILA